jgi:hypothetical protein
MGQNPDRRLLHGIAVIKPEPSPPASHLSGRELHEGRNAIRLTLGMRKIDRDTLKLQPYKKLKKDATLWLSDDADRVPIELRAAAFIADVRARLTAHRKL